MDMITAVVSVVAIVTAHAAALAGCGCACADEPATPRSKVAPSCS